MWNPPPPVLLSAAVKVENLFRRVSRHFGGPRPSADPADILVNQDSSTNSDVVHLEDSFKQLMNKVGDLVDHSVALVSKMRTKLDTALQLAFLNDTAALTEETTSEPFSPSRDSGFLQGVGVEEVLDSFFDFGKSVLDEFGAVVTQVFDNISEAVREEKEKGKRGHGVLLSRTSQSNSSSTYLCSRPLHLLNAAAARESFPRLLKDRKLCRDLRRQTSECWQLQGRCEVCQGALLSGETPPTLTVITLRTMLLYSAASFRCAECPSVRELHVELDEVSQLLDVSREQYDEILSIVQHHTDETVNWLGAMAAEFGWVGWAGGDGSSPESVFRITKVRGRIDSSRLHLLTLDMWRQVVLRCTHETSTAAGPNQLIISTCIAHLCVIFTNISWARSALLLMKMKKSKVVKLNVPLLANNRYKKIASGFKGRTSAVIL